METRTKYLLSILAVGVLLGGLGFLSWQRIGLAKITKNEVAKPELFQNFQFFATSTGQINNATSTPASATSTSNAITPYFDSNGTYDNGTFVVRGAKKVTLYFSRADATPATGTSTFMVDVSPDGTTWVQSNKLITNVVNGNTQTPIRTSAVVMTPVSTAFATSATTTVALDVSYDAIYAIRCVVGSLVDGDNYCSASASW